MNRNFIMMPGSNYNEHIDNQYNCFGGTQINHSRATGCQNATRSDEYFCSPIFDSSIKRLAQHMEQFKTIHWSHVYLYLHQYLNLEEMTAAKFGKFIESHGGPNEQKVRKDGNYQPSSLELLKDKPIIESVSAFFSIN